MASVTLLTKCLSRSVDVVLRLLAHARFLREEDLAVILSDRTERLLNLPGGLPFFVTKPTAGERIDTLLRSLHPMACSKELIRLGPNGDGGYLVPNDLAGIEACFSPGVSDRAGFERDCAERGMKVFMADASVEGPPESHPQFRFIKKFIGATSRGDFISLGDWFKSSLPEGSGDLLLQMDIEGYEYEALLSLPEDWQPRFRIMVVEFHFLDYLFSEPLFAIYSKVFEKLLSTHTCVHIHPNNVCTALKVGQLQIPQMAEFTFLRHDRVSNPAFARTFPHMLDRDNCGRPPLPLPKSCYR